MTARKLHRCLAVAILLLTTAVVSGACNDGDGKKTATATPSPAAPGTPSADGTPGNELGGMDGFRAFASQIEQGIADGEAQFFLERAVLEELTCAGDEPVGPCAGRPAGTVTGIPGGVWQGDAGGIFTPEEYELALQRYFDGALAAESDDYGSGGLALFALARGEVDGEEVFFAITTSIVDTYPATGAPIGMLLREAHAFRFAFAGGRWRFMGETVAVAEAATADWLSGQCADCYADWERWTGTATGLQDPSEAAATAIAGSAGFPTTDEAIQAYAEAWRQPFLGDCDALEEPQPGSCLPADREVGESEATYRLCVLGTDACLIVTFARGSNGRWTLSRVESGGPGPAQELVP